MKIHFNQLQCFGNWNGEGEGDGEDEDEDEDEFTLDSFSSSSPSWPVSEEDKNLLNQN